MSLRDRGNTEEHTDSEGTWALSYGDLITVVLTFFILFFNVNRNTSESTRLELQESLVKNLKTKFSEPKIVTDEKAEQNAMEKSDYTKWGGRVYQFGQRIVIEFPGTSFFKKGQTELNPKAIAVFKNFVKAYEPYMGQNSLSVKAFTDRTRVAHGHRFHDNLELSALRAISAMRTLQNMGIPLRLMRISGQGEFPTTARNLASAAKKLGYTEDVTDELARKVVLIVEPSTQEKL